MKHMTLALLLAPLALQAEIAVQTVAYEDLGNKDRVVTNITGSADADLTPATNYTDSATNELRRTTDEKSRASSIRSTRATLLTRVRSVFTTEATQQFYLTVLQPR